MMAYPQRFWPLFVLGANALFVLGCDSGTSSKSTFPSSKPTLQQKTESAAPAIDSARAETVHDSLAILATASDTFRVNTGRVFRMEKITETQYKKAVDSGREKVLPADSAAAVAVEAVYLQGVAGRVWRRADTLCFKTQQGTVIKLENGPTYQNTEDSYEGYRFLDNLGSIKQWLVEVGKWEGRYYLLIDQQTGKRTDLISYPVVSPDRRHFACANSSPTGYDLSGIQLWVKPVGSPPRLRWQRISDSTQPGISAFGPRWENNTTLLFCEDFITATRYMRIKL